MTLSHRLLIGQTHHDGYLADVFPTEANEHQKGGTAMISKRLGIVGGMLLLLTGCSQDLGGADMEVTPDMTTPIDMTITLKGSCDFRKNSPASQECRDYESTSTQFISTYKGTCTNAAAWLDTLCNHTGALGGCRTDIPNLGGGTLTQWYFTQSGIMTQADVQTKCTAGGQTFVAP